MRQWFYGENGQQAGPIDESGLHALIASGQIGRAILLWREGLPRWLTLDQLRPDGGLDRSTSPQFVGHGMIHPPGRRLGGRGMAISGLVMGYISVAVCVGGIIQSGMGVFANAPH